MNFIVENSNDIKAVKCKLFVSESGDLQLLVENSLILSISSSGRLHRPYLDDRDIANGFKADQYGQIEIQE